VTETQKAVCKSKWQLRPNNQYVPCRSTESRLPTGIYSVWVDFPNMETLFRRIEQKTDNLIDSREPIAQKVMEEMKQFWDVSDQYRKFGYLHKRGYLFYGPHGSGKTSIVQQIVQFVIQNDGVIFTVDDPHALIWGLREYRSIEPDRKTVCIFEDIDTIVEKREKEGALLQLIDGETQIDNILYLATTNYPEKLDKRILSRPRRFDRVLKVEMPSAVTRQAYFDAKLTPTNGTNIDEWVEATEGFSFGAMAELVINVKCLGIPYEIAIADLKHRQEKKPSSDEFSRGCLGFRDR